MRDTERERQRHRQREKQAPRRKPHGGLYPGTLGSHPGLKVGAKPPSHPGIPSWFVLNEGRELIDHVPVEQQSLTLAVGEISRYS